MSLSYLEVANTLVILVYLTTLTHIGVGVVRLWNTVLHGMFKSIIWIFYILLTIQIVVFIVFQIQWVLDSQNENVGDIAAYGWAFYDYVNGLTHLAFVIATNLYLGWKTEDYQRHRYHKV